MKDNNFKRKQKPKNYVSKKSLNSSNGINIIKLKDSPGISNYVSNISISHAVVNEDSLNETEFSLNTDEKILNHRDNKDMLNNVYRTQSKSNYIKGAKEKSENQEESRFRQSPKFNMTFNESKDETRYLNQFSEISSIIVDDKNFCNRNVNRVTGRFGYDKYQENYHSKLKNSSNKKPHHKSSKDNRSISSSNGQLLSHQSVFDKSSYLATSNDQCNFCRNMKPKIISLRKDKMDLNLQISKLRSENQTIRDRNNKLEKIVEEKLKIQEKDREYILKQEKEIRRLILVMDNYNKNLQNINMKDLVKQNFSSLSKQIENKYNSTYKESESSKTSSIIIKEKTKKHVETTSPTLENSEMNLFQNLQKKYGPKEQVIIASATVSKDYNSTEKIKEEDLNEFFKV
jgi:hypothetical protein